MTRLPQQLADIVPRAVLVLLCWGLTYCILTALSTQLPPALIYFAGVMWVLAGVFSFGYLYRLRREADATPHRAIGNKK